MPRYKNEQWDIKGTVVLCPEAQLAVLMDIRDELRAMNNLLCCPRFLGIPNTLKAIERNTRKKRKAPRQRRKD